MVPIRSLTVQLRVLTREYKKAVKAYGRKLALGAGWYKDVDVARGVVDDLKARMDSVSDQINNHDWGKDL